MVIASIKRTHNSKNMATMNLMDFKITLKDIIQIAILIIAGAFFVFKIQSSQERTTEQIMELKVELMELKSDGKSGTKENQIFLQSIQNQVNTTTTQLMVLDQRVSFLEQQMRDNK